MGKLLSIQGLDFMAHQDNVDISYILNQDHEFLVEVLPMVNDEHLFSWLEQTMDPKDPGDAAAKIMLNLKIKRLNQLEAEKES